MYTPVERNMDAERWDELMDACRVECTEARRVALAQLVKAYTEPHRFYHTLHHINYMLDGLFIDSSPVEMMAVPFLGASR
jgi:predicted metal-dependent HD superfamily phosphohydrolase